MTEKMYDLICRERFDSIEGKQDEVLAILKGSDHDPGLCEQVREIKRTYKAVVGAAVFILSVFSIQLIVWVVDEIKAAFGH